MALITPQYLQTQSYTAAKDRYALSRLDLQPGVFGAGDFKATQRGAGANMSVDIAAGDAWVAGTDTTRQGNYMVTNDALVNVATDTTGVAWAVGNGSLPRIDQVILRLFDTQDGSSANGNKTSDGAQLLVLLGTATSGATLDNRTGAAALPSSCIRLADVLVPAAATTVTTANIRDRRPWARGAYFRATRSAADYTTGSASFVPIDSTNLLPRIECSGNPLKIMLLSQWTHSVGSGTVILTPWIDSAAAGVGTNGLTRTQQSVAVADILAATFDVVPSAGSHTVGVAYATSAATLTLNASATRSLIMTIEEIVRPNASNT